MGSLWSGTDSANETFQHRYGIGHTGRCAARGFGRAEHVLASLAPSPTAADAHGNFHDFRQLAFAARTRQPRSSPAGLRARGRRVGRNLGGLRLGKCDRRRFGRRRSGGAQYRVRGQSQARGRGQSQARGRGQSQARWRSDGGGKLAVFRGAAHGQLSVLLRATNSVGFPDCSRWVQARNLPLEEPKILGTVLWITSHQDRDDRHRSPFPMQSPTRDRFAL